jgi:hypothetical protein
MTNSSNQPVRCECHECTQARYRMSFEWQLDQGRAKPQAPLMPSMTNQINVGAAKQEPQ